jgi:ADP-ribose pyrophosphatase
MKIISKERVRKGFLNIDELTIETPEGKQLKREVVNRGNAVAALVYDTKKEKYILTKQYRPGTEKTMVEVVAGTLDVEGEEPADCMKREIMEEIGYKTDSIVHLYSFAPSPGGLSEIIHLFYAEVSEQVTAGGGVEDEGIELVELTKDGLVPEFVEDAKTIIAFLWAKLRK